MRLQNRISLGYREIKVQNIFLLENFFLLGSSACAEPFISLCPHSVKEEIISSGPNPL